MQVEFLGSFPDLSGRPQPALPEFAFIGRSNCGKSSLINYLLGRRALAHTSRQPGKTRLLNYYRVNDRFDLVDLPGYGYARVSKTQRDAWWGLLRRYLTGDSRLTAALLLLDGRRVPDALDEQVAAMLQGQPRPFAVVITKLDKLAQRERKPAFLRIINGLRLEPDTPFLLTSAHRGIGRAEVRAWLDEVLTAGDHGV